MLFDFQAPQVGRWNYGVIVSSWQLSGRSVVSLTYLDGCEQPENRWCYSSIAMANCSAGDAVGCADTLVQSILGWVNKH